MNPVLRPLLVARACSLMIVFLAGTVALETAHGQTSSEVPRGPEAGGARRGFSLFANADFAISGMRARRTFAWAVSNIGPCAAGSGPVQANGCGLFLDEGFHANDESLFEVVLSAGVPLTDFQKIRAVYPGVENHLGPTGYTELSTHLRVGVGSQDWGPADGSLGRLFSGVKSTNDLTCRDDSGRYNNFIQTGTSLLASSDCPATWPATGFDGPRVVDAAAFVKQKAQQGPAFTFDWFRVPAVDRSHRLLGSFSTYGEISDHFTDALQSYGGVTPKYPGRSPTRNGFPLGLDIRFDAFTFAQPILANAVFWQMTVVNNSKDVYGTGIDYDSLYMGLSNGLAIALQDGTSAQYTVPQRNAIFAVRSAVNTGCNGALTNRPEFGGSCITTGGFRLNHAFGIMMLKSPIGDTRNKLLTRPGPFYDPASPYADDTLTFNHHHYCGFSLCYGGTSVTPFNDRRAFGMISSTEANVLDGRDPASLTDAQRWYTFRSKTHPASPTTQFNRYVPGTWSYENKVRPPGLSAAARQDTLFSDWCDGSGFITIPTENGGRPLPRCSVAFSDTFPGKQIVGNGGNIGSVMTAGPFPLRAGDTTSFIIAFFAERDSLGFVNAADAITNEYLNFFPGDLAPPPTPTIGGAEVISAQMQRATGQRPAVKLLFSDEPEVHTDSYLTRFANDIRTAPGQYFRRLRHLNPALADSIDRAATNNFAEILIYRSCDGGRAFDTRSTCASLAGSTSRTPATPYASVRATNFGTIPNTWTDTTVVPGVTYLYSLVTRSRGLQVGVIDVDLTDKSTTCVADTTFAACRKVGRVLTVVDTLISALATEGPSTAKVHVPIASPTGGQVASVRVTTASGAATVPFVVTLAERPVAGTYRAIFGNRFIVQRTTNTATNVTSSVVRVQSVIPSAVRNGVDIANFVEREVVLSGPGVVDLAGVTYTPAIATSVGTRVELDTISGLGFVLALENRPLFLSQSLAGTESAPTTPPSFVGRADFPGFTVSLQNSPAVLQKESIILPSGDTLADDPDSVSVEFREQTSSRVGGTGRYTFTFSGDPFGPGAPFDLQAPNVQTAFTSSLASRVNLTVGDTSARIRAIAGSSGNPIRPMRFPFSVTAASGNNVIVVGRSRNATGSGSTKTTFLLGLGADTLRVPVDSLTWLPGDPFTLLETMRTDSVDVAGRVVINPTTNQPYTRTDTVVAFGSFNGVILGCDSPRQACNPVIASEGSPAYRPHVANTRITVEYPVAFTSRSELDIRVTAPLTLVSLTRASLQEVRVVPNPFVLYSKYESGSEPRMMFAGVPARGTLRIYSVSGQLVQQLTWNQGDLLGETSGDLPWNLRMRDGRTAGTGLYIYVLTAFNERGKQVTGRGKFVIIR